MPRGIRACVGLILSTGGRHVFVMLVGSVWAVVWANKFPRCLTAARDFLLVTTRAIL